MTQKPDENALGKTKSIDRDSYTPAYAQLARILKMSMADGIFKSGDQLPSESQMVKHYRVSPMTVRRAINILIDQGYLVAEQGRGTFVKPLTIGEAAFKLQELQEIFCDEARTSVNILETRIAKADDRTAKKLEIPVGHRTVFIRRVIYLENFPILYHREHIIYDPKLPIVEAELEVTSLQRLFSGTGDSMIKSGDIRLDATLLNEEEADILKVQLPVASFCLQHIFYDFEDKPVSWGRFVGRPDSLRFTARVGIQNIGDEKHE
jgi:DNA-binding GntR family transcriptional regulator